MNVGFTERARQTVTLSHRHYASADLLQNGVVVKPGILLDEDNGAEVSVDGSAAIRRTFSATLPDAASYLPITPGGLLSPFLTEIAVWSGIVYPDGNFDRWCVFTGAIEEPKVTDDGGDIRLEISASDRAQTVSEHRLSAPFSINAGTLVTYAIQTLVKVSLPPALRSVVPFQIATPSANPTLPASVIDELEDPWQHAQDLAAAYGMECYFNGAGTCVIAPILDPNSQLPVWSFTEGDSAIVTEIDTVLSAKGAYSHAMVTGQSLNGASPVRADVYDTEPSSYTYYLGPFGDRPVKLQSDLITTQAQADAAAVGLLARQKGALQSVGFTHVPLTALDEHDSVYIARSRLGLADTFTLESFSLPLYPGGTMSPTCRSRQL